MIPALDFLDLPPGLLAALVRHRWEPVGAPEGWEPGPEEYAPPRPATAAQGSLWGDR